jgi:putative endonuclease
MNFFILSMWYVYKLKCCDATFYVGCTSNIEQRLIRHHAKQVHYTSSRLPVTVVSYTAFADKYKAYEFEKYLKSGSGRAFAKKRLI